MNLGLLAIAFNFYLVGGGTYIYYSWDVMEPIAYFIQSSVQILFTYQILKLG